MFYLWLKFVHILSATILFGTGIGTASVFLYSHYSKNIAFIAGVATYVVLADWLFTATSAFVQLVTGLFMLHIAGYPLSLMWIWGSLLGYFIAIGCWVPVVYLQIKMRDLAKEALQSNVALPTQYYNYFRYWFFLGWPAFISLVIVFYLMINKPY